MQRQTGAIKDTPSKKPKVKIYIDGPNFYHGLKGMGKKYREFQFNFSKLGLILRTKNRELIGINYYSSPLKQQRNPEVYQQQQRFFARLRSNCITVILCKTKYRLINPNIFIQQSKGTIKGDDIAIAVDMLSDAYENVYDDGILVSSDGDFVPLVKKLQEMGKKVEILYFENSKSWELITRVVSKSLIRKCFIPRDEIY
ncbi:MAG: LabA-like NYN domain-containing protein [Promethearchaeota archaeon]